MIEWKSRRVARLALAAAAAALILLSLAGGALAAPPGSLLRAGLVRDRRRERSARRARHLLGCAVVEGQRAERRRRARVVQGLCRRRRPRLRGAMDNASGQQLVPARDG